MDLIVVMPAYNEGECIEAVAMEWLGILNVIEGKLLVINDGSEDATRNILDGIAEKDQRLIVIHGTNSGHGPAILSSYRKALEFQADFVFQTDSDDQIGATEFWKLWRRRSEASLVLGMRSNRSDAPYRLLITRILEVVNLIFFGMRIRDPNVPFRLFRTDVLQQLLPLIPRDVFAPNIFLSLIAARLPRGIVQVPVQHVRRHSGSESLCFWTFLCKCTRSAVELLKFRFSSRGSRQW